MGVFDSGFFPSLPLSLFLSFSLSLFPPPTVAIEDIRAPLPFLLCYKAEEEALDDVVRREGDICAKCI